MDFLDALDLRDALEHRANRVRLTALERRVFSAVLRQTVRRGRLEDSVSHDFLARFADCHPKEVGPVLRAMTAISLIRYTPGVTVARVDGKGHRRTYSKIAVVIPPKWKDFAGTDWDPEPVEEGQMSTPRRRKDLPPVRGKERPSEQGEGKTFPTGSTSFLPPWGKERPGTKRNGQEEATGCLSETDSTETGGWGVEFVTHAQTAREEDNPTPEVVVAEIVEEQEPAPVPMSAALTLVPASLEESGHDHDGEALALVAEFAEACCADGHPLIEPSRLVPGVKASLDHYSPAEVMVGLGFWRAEAFCVVKQIPEFVERSAALGGPPPANATTITLLREGAARYTRPRPGPRRMSANEQKEKDTMASIANYRRREKRGGAR